MARKAQAQTAWTARDISAAYAKVHGIAVSGLQVRTIVRTTDRVPRLRSEPAQGNRSHVYTAREATMVVDGLHARSSLSAYSADKVLTAMGVPTGERDTARKAYDRDGTGVRRKHPTAPSRAASGRSAADAALGKRRVTRPPQAPAQAPTDAPSA